MRRLFSLLLLLSLILGLGSCAPAPKPTYTPVPTATPLPPTATPLPPTPTPGPPTVTATSPPALPPASLWEGFAYNGTYTIEVDQPSALVDAPLTIRITSLQPKQPVTLRAQLVTAISGQTWESLATFTADNQGIVDVRNATPLYGTYKKADGMGLFWSLLPGATDPAKVSRTATLIDPLVVTLTAEAKGQVLASATVERLWFSKAQVTRQPVQKAGLVGTLFCPNTPGRYPTVICLGGSEGGLWEIYAALLASHGYTALALAYFGIYPLPAELVEIPLEYFADAIAWLKIQPTVDPERIAVMGGSRGGELALLLGATYPQDIKAVIGRFPSAVIYQGISYYSGGPRSAWSLGGKPVPFLAYASTPELLSFLMGRPAAIRASYERPLDDESAVAAASIAVEKINGPVLLISGTDDQVWPSTRLSDMAIARLKANNHAFAYEHLRYEGAGHTWGIPYVPLAQVGNLLTGGSREANAAASVDSWPKTLAFLDKYLKRGR